MYAAKTTQDLLDKVQTGLDRIRKSGFLLNPEKCEFMVSPMTYLGRVLYEDDIGLDPGDISTIRDWPRPEDPRSLQRFLGMARWVAEHVPAVRRES